MTERKIKILYISQTLKYGGSERQLVQLIQHINKNEFECYLIVTGETDNNLIAELKSINIPLFIINSNKGIFVKLLKIRKYIKRIKPNLIHGFLLVPSIFAYIGSMGIKLDGFFISIRSTSLYNNNKILQIVFRLFGHFILNRCSQVLSNSKRVQIFIRTFFFVSFNKIKNIYNGIDINRFRKSIQKELKTEKEQIIIGTVGKDSFAKNVGMLLSVVKHTLSYRNNIKFLLIGYDNKIFTKYNIHNLKKYENRITFISCTPDIVKYYNKMDIFILTSLYEGLPNAVMEAMSMEIPVITTDVGGVSEVITNGEDGFIVPINDINLMCDKIKFLTLNSEIRNKISKKARLNIITNFPLSKTVNETEALYKNI